MGDAIHKNIMWCLCDIQVDFVTNVHMIRSVWLLNMCYFLCVPCQWLARVFF